MKFMGSKRWMLGNGLGELLDKVAPQKRRFVDLFCGSGAVSSFVATRHKVKVVATDLQQFGASLTAATIERTAVLDVPVIWNDWSRAAARRALGLRTVPTSAIVTKRFVAEAREWCASRRNTLITEAYGGHYFSPLQAVWFDALLESLPEEPSARKAARAALIQAASQCAAAPGHTAQPFQPTPSARPFLQEAWNKRVSYYVELALCEIGKKCAIIRGKAYVSNALAGAARVDSHDLVFIDPPYSDVQYSRFYHVLETMSGAPCGKVSGIGRYPAPEHRPTSAFSLKTQALEAMEALLSTLAKRRASVVLTFPNHMCSTGLSGDGIRKIASRIFVIREKLVSSRFSTLGGPGPLSTEGGRRGARFNASELILLMRPKRRQR